MGEVTCGMVGGIWSGVGEGISWEHTETVLARELAEPPMISGVLASVTFSHRLEGLSVVNVPGSFAFFWFTMGICASL